MIDQNSVITRMGSIETRLTAIACSTLMDHGSVLTVLSLMSSPRGRVVAAGPAVAVLAAAGGERYAVATAAAPAAQHVDVTLNAARQSKAAASQACPT